MSDRVLGVHKTKPTALLADPGDPNAVQPDGKSAGHLPVSSFKRHPDAELPEHAQDTPDLLRFLPLFKIRQVRAVEPGAFGKLSLGEPALQAVVPYSCAERGRGVDPERPVTLAA